MKSLITAAALMLFTQLCSAQITSSGQVYVAADDLKSYASPTLYAEACYNSISQVVTIRVIITNPSTEPSDLGSFYVIATKADLDLYASAGDGDTGKWISVVYQFVIDYLEAIPSNASTTFSLI